MSYNQYWLRDDLTLRIVSSLEIHLTSSIFTWFLADVFNFKFFFFPGDSSKNQNNFEYDQENKIENKDVNINQENLNFLSNHKNDTIRGTDQADNEAFEVEAILDYQTNVSKHSSEIRCICLMKCPS